ncbi:MAG: lysine exporter protein LysE/YggA [Chloroflexi bacterium OLB14]|nr:MAG: lysine exporter protein LysE/YggA [Chloroflexi bacterium OLB14]
MLIYLIQGFGFGLAAASQPGPFQTYLISQTLTRGWKKSLINAFAPLLSDFPIILLCTLVLSQIPAWFQQFLYIASGLFILYLAYGTYKTWKNFSQNQAQPESKIDGLPKAILMNFLSPGPYIFWSLVTGPILIQAWRESILHGVGFLISFYLTMICGYFLIIIVFGQAQKLGANMNRIMLGISAIALFLFGLYQLWQGISLII